MVENLPPLLRSLVEMPIQEKAIANGELLYLWVQTGGVYLLAPFLRRRFELTIKFTTVAKEPGRLSA